MMASQQNKLHDPMYSFDTRFPERLSRLHLHSEAPASFRKKKSRAQRSNFRYKTQPVTFDEIKEVDEEPIIDENLQPDNLMGQLQAFSRSMDGLIPRSAIDHSHFHHHGTHSRSGSRKFHRHPDCIPEKVEAEQQQQQLHQLPSLHLPTTQDNVVSCTEDPPSASDQSKHLLEASAETIPSATNMASRRQKVTAKAKKRQKASEGQ